MIDKALLLNIFFFQKQIKKLIVRKKNNARTTHGRTPCSKYVNNYSSNICKYIFYNLKNKTKNFEI